MFSAQMPDLMAMLTQYGISQQIASAFGDILGNCTQALEHRGPVTLSGPDPNGAGGNNVTNGYALNVTQGSTINNQGDSIFAGNNLFTSTSDTTFDGTVNLNGNTTYTGNVTAGSGTWDFTGTTIHGWPSDTLDVKVKVNSDDPTTGYLEDQMRDGHVQASAQYNATNDLLVEVDTVDVAGDKKLRAYVDASDLTNWDNSHEFVLGWTSSGTLNVFAWGLVKVDSGDTAGYLGTRFELGGSFASATDLKAYEQTVSHQVRVFTRFSDLSGYSAGSAQYFKNDSGTMKFVTQSTLTPSATTVVTAVSFDTDTCVATVTTGTAYTFPSSSAVHVLP